MPYKIENKYAYIKNIKWRFESMADKKTSSEAQKKAYKTYNSKSIQLAVNYRPTDIKDGERVKAYLEQTGQSAKEFLSQNSLKANAYIKSLIKADLDAKGFSVGSVATMDIDSVDTL